MFCVADRGACRILLHVQPGGRLCAERVPASAALLAGAWPVVLTRSLGCHLRTLSAPSIRLPPGAGPLCLRPCLPASPPSCLLAWPLAMPGRRTLATCRRASGMPHGSTRPLTKGSCRATPIRTTNSRVFSAPTTSLRAPRWPWCCGAWRACLGFTRAACLMMWNLAPGTRRRLTGAWRPAWSPATPQVSTRGASVPTGPSAAKSLP